jgi:hypothetical protein
MMVDFCWMLQRDVPKKTYSRQSVKRSFLTKRQRCHSHKEQKNLVRFLTKNYYKHLIFLNRLLNFFLLIVKKPDVIQKNELYFCNQGSNVIQNQLSSYQNQNID